jgi:beta-glucosidase-like glycosyl hydrolase
VKNLLGAPINAPTDAIAVSMAINNGTDIEMGSTLFANYLLDAVNQNLTTEDVVTNSLRRVLHSHVS